MSNLSEGMERLGRALRGTGILGATPGISRAVKNAMYFEEDVQNICNAYGVDPDKVEAKAKYLATHTTMGYDAALKVIRSNIAYGNPFALDIPIQERPLMADDTITSNVQNPDGIGNHYLYILAYSDSDLASEVSDYLNDEISISSSRYVHTEYDKAKVVLEETKKEGQHLAMYGVDIAVITFPTKDADDAEASAEDADAPADPDGMVILQTPDDLKDLFIGDIIRCHKCGTGFQIAERHAVKELRVVSETFIMTTLTKIAAKVQCPTCSAEIWQKKAEPRLGEDAKEEATD